MAIPNLPDKNYFSIREVSYYTGVKPYVLRYWESEFKLLAPARRDSGHRKYRHKDIEKILKVKKLLYEKKFTIAGARRYLLDEHKRGPQQLKMEFADDSAAVDTLKKVKKDVDDIIQLLK